MRIFGALCVWWRTDRSSLLRFSAVVVFVMTAKPTLSGGPSGTQGGLPKPLPPPES